MSRRRFMESAAVAVGVCAVPEWCSADPARLSIPPGRKRSRVVHVQNALVVEGQRVHAALIKEMLDASLLTLTEAKSVGQAWQSILDPTDVVGLKFNRSGQPVMGTTDALARTVITSLIESGWPAKRIVCIEVPGHVQADMGTAEPWSGYEPRNADFGSGADALARVVSQVTAIISIPFIKTHNIAGLTCSLKNLSHGLTRHPARYHANHCSPYVADIVANTPIGKKLRLCIVDGLRVMFDGGPAGSSDMLSDQGILLLSQDPVATDAIAFGILNRLREERKLPRIAEAPEDIAYLAQAHRNGLGIVLEQGIEHVRLAT